MAVKVLLPQFGESVVEGTITKWLKGEGDSIEEYEPLVEVNTDKVDTEVPSPASGTILRILVGEGTTAAAGTLLAWIGEPGEAIPAGDMPSIQPEEGMAIPEPETVLDEIPPSSDLVLPPEPYAVSDGISSEAGVEMEVAPRRPGRDEELGFISPVVARMASENGVDLSQVPGTGRGGRITKKDLLQYIENTPAPVRPPLAVPESVPTAEAPPAAAPGELLHLGPVRKAIAAHMVQSKHTSPHVSTVMEADLSKVVAHRAVHKDVFARDGASLTFTPYFVAASVDALRAYPLVNSSWLDEGIQLHRDIHIGMATSLGEEGLIVPVIKNADSLSLLGIARQVNDLANRARAKTLRPDEVQGGTFTITNHGISGSLFATPIINQPQCAILGVGLIQKRVVVIDDAIAIRPMVYLSLTFDHRILDGAIADHFLSKIVDTLQNWSA